ncbi:hypothetical protein KM043_008153 [Ampulex compressa]|nr:hypothetical protein KM043_008153 [Ampulex compressa]
MQASKPADRQTDRELEKVEGMYGERGAQWSVISGSLHPSKRVGTGVEVAHVSRTEHPLESLILLSPRFSPCERTRVLFPRRVRQRRKLPDYSRLDKELLPGCRRRSGSRHSRGNDVGSTDDTLVVVPSTVLSMITVTTALATAAVVVQWQRQWWTLLPVEKPSRRSLILARLAWSRPRAPFNVDPIPGSHEIIIRHRLVPSLAETSCGWVHPPSGRNEMPVLLLSTSLRPHPRLRPPSFLD